MARGRLIWPLMADIRQIDTVATSQDPDGAGPLTTGYDQDFKEPIVLPPAGGSGAGTINRKEKSSVLIPCQVEVPRFGQAQLGFTGNISQDQIILVMHFQDLEDLGLVDVATKEPALRVGDRLAGIYRKDGTLEQAFDRNPLFATQVQPSSFGLTSIRRNLLIVTFDKRDKGATT